MVRLHSIIFEPQKQCLGSTLQLIRTFEIFKQVQKF